MGVHGLWGLLAPVGRRVSVETLAGKRLAVDASIWMVQFMRAMRDDKGDMIRDAHILGFLRRICKLLFLRARPVFVFDGATPALKRRTLAARRRHRDAAQAKVRKTAEKLLISHLKASRLEELAAQIKSDRAKHDAKGKQVESTRVEETEITNGDQNRNDDGESSRGTVAPINQEKLDELLAASLAAEDEADFIGKGEHNSASVTLQEGIGIDEDENDDDEEMIFPMTTGDLDPAVLASLPPSMQLDLLVQMRERVMAENRQKYQKIKKEPAKFSELQIQSYLKTVAFRREIEEVQRGAAGKDVGGIQTSKIASEANREFIFSSSFTGDKQTLAQRGVDEHIVDSVKSKRGIGSAVFKSSPSSTSRSINPHNSEPSTDFGPDVETYRDERGRMRVSRVRAMGIRMTRDIQRNLDFIKEHEQAKIMGHANVSKGSTSNEEPPDFPEHLFENDRLQSSIGLTEDLAETIGVDDNTSSLVGGSDDICEDSDHGSKETIEISFVDDQIGAKDNDDELFLHLVSGTSSSFFTDDDRLAKNAEESDNSEGIWEEGVIEEEILPKKVGEKDYQSSLPDNCSADDEVEWEEGGFDVPSSSEYNQFKLPRGDIEEEALIQEAIRRSLEDSEKQEFENGVPKDLQTSDVPEPSEAPGTTDYNFEASFCKETIKELGVESNAGEDGVMPDPEVLEADGQENKNQAQRESNDGQTGTNKDYSPGSLPPYNLYNLSTSTPAARPSPSSKENDTIISAPTTHEWPKDDSDEVIKYNTSNSHKSECNTNDPYIGETSKAPQKELLMDELVANTAIQKENVVQEDINITKLSENYDSNIISENNLEEEISFLRQEQVDLGNERRKFESHAESVSSEMFAECQELLQMFGLPYIIAPMEAEAQCAYMEINNLVDGVVTDDSDVFLFGARNVYKNIFDERKYVETYLMKDIESELGLTREQLIRMALLLGSDYTEGISGIGIVNAIEVVNAFPEEDGLQKFREWIESPDPAILGKLDMETSGSSKRRKPGANESCEKGNSLQPECVEGPDDNQSSNEKQHVKEVFMSKHRNVSKNWHIPSTFPSETVISAYISPQVDDSTERFSWGRPDLSLLRKLCWERFGWNKEKADELLLPVLKEYNKHETQLRMEAFYSFNERFAKIRSKRVQKAIKGITGKTFSETDELNEDSPSTSSASKKKEADPSKPRGKQNTSAGPRQMGSHEDDKIGDPNSFADAGADELVKEHRSASKKKSAVPSGRSRGRGRKRMNVGQETSRNQEDSEIKGSTLPPDEDSHKRHTDNYKPEGTTVRRSNRKRKQVTYMEDEHEADDNDVPLHQVDSNDPSQTATDGDMAGRDAQFNMLRQDTGELNSDQMHEDPHIAEDINEDPLGFELGEDQSESAPKEYLFTGGGFCMEEEDEQGTSIDRSGGETVDGISDACEDIGVVSDGGKITEAPAASSSKRHNPSRGLPTPIKRRRK
ncbi:DNA repair protein UVH3-like [Lolium rigidum]|uniref:DNA repair protein UVH3-like n=1 Tax=Lolium rigidum TaxID=89674 RepID=UPI001F5CD6E9|nr:DNA repair protein UVH3-like [Lolium rigidum]